MWWIIFILIGFVWYAAYKEGMTSSPSDMVQQHSGELQQLHDKLMSIQVNATGLEALQDENDQMNDQLNQLQASLPSDDVNDAYP
jgi:Tfp pilus assembly protein PilO